MNSLWAAALILLNSVWLVLVVVGLPGTWLMVISAGVVTWLQWNSHIAGGGAMFSVATLAAATALAVVGEVLEFFAGVTGARKAGGSKRGTTGALVGGLVGGIAATFIIPIPLLGSLIGACIGAAIGALAFELSGGREIGASVQSGVGAGLGRLAGSMLKVGVGAAIWLLLAVAAFV